MCYTGHKQTYKYTEEMLNGQSQTKPSPIRLINFIIMNMSIFAID